MATFTVTTANDENNNDSQISLREALNLANQSSGKDTIIFDPILDGETINLSLGQLRITDSVDINTQEPQNIKIDAERNSRVLEINDRSDSNKIDVTLNRLNISGGFIPFNEDISNPSFFNGGGIRNRENLIISNSEISDNSSFNFRGGAIYNLKNGTISIIESSIRGNSAGIENDGFITIDRSSLTENGIRTISTGGAIINNGILEITNSDVSNNRAGSGAGFYNQGDLSIDSVTISDNFALSSGAINNSGIVEIVNSNITGNSLDPIINSGELNISYSNISDNQGNVGSAILSVGTINISNSQINNNSSAISGALRIEGEGKISDSEINNNNGENGSAIDISLGEVTLNNNTIMGNSSDKNGGAIAIKEAIVNINNSTISNNISEQNGGAIYNNLGILNIDSSQIINNTSGTVGGGISNNKSRTEIVNSVISSNSAFIGGGIFSESSEDNFEDSLIENNMASFGGGVAINNGTINRNNTEINNNLASVSNNNLLNPLSDINSSSIVTIVDDEIDGNLDDNDLSLREAILFSDDGDIITFDPSLSGERINLSLGEIVINKSITIRGLGVNNLTIFGNDLNRIFTIDDSNNSQNINVAIESLRLTEGRDNIDGGGAILNRETLTISNTQLDSNSSNLENGGAIQNTRNGNLTINNTSFVDNRASNGGGIYNQGTLEINNSNIEGNSASNDGGGISNAVNAILNLSEDTTFTNNSSDGNGDDIFQEIPDVCTSTNGDDILNNCATSRRDTISGKGGNDSLFGRKGNDNLFGGSGQDTLNGGKGKDNLFGGRGKDILNGGRGNDNLFGGNGTDIIRGGSGMDTLIGGSGMDTLIGGSGNDIFVIESLPDNNRNIILDFEDGIDRLGLSENLTFDNLIITNNPSNSATVIRDDNNNRLAIIEGINPSQIDINDFEIVNDRF